MAQKRPTEALQQRWLHGILLPGIDDPRESCLTELCEYTGRSREDVEALCRASRERLKEVWQERSRDDAESIEDFYRHADAYLYGLLWWHCLQKGPAVAWNARILELAQERGVRTCLEYGGGIGSLALALSRAGVETTLADISQPSLEFARWRAQRRNLALRTIDLSKDELGDETFDLVTAIDVLEHVADPIATLEELTRRVRVGGYLCFDLIAGRLDPEEPFHLMRSKFPIRSRVRAMGLAPVSSFGKYLVLQRVERSRLWGEVVRAWDVARWRLYYLAQGQWPASR